MASARAAWFWAAANCRARCAVSTASENRPASAQAAASVQRCNGLPPSDKRTSCWASSTALAPFRTDASGLVASTQAGASRGASDTTCGGDPPARGSFRVTPKIFCGDFKDNGSHAGHCAVCLCVFRRSALSRLVRANAKSGWIVRVSLNWATASSTIPFLRKAMPRLLRAEA